MDGSSSWPELSALNLAAALTDTAEQSGQRFRRWNDVWVSDREIPNAEANFVVLTRPLLLKAVAELTSRLVDFFRETETPWILWSAWPVPDLVPHGYKLGGYPPLMVLERGDLTEPSATNLRIVQAEDPSSLIDFERTFIDGYGLPMGGPFRPGQLFGAETLAGPMRYWVGYKGNRAVSVAAGFTAHGVHGIYCVATLPDERGHGYGTAVTHAAIAETELPTVLQASDKGFPVYRRLGFQEVGKFALWTGPSSVEPTA